MFFADTTVLSRSKYPLHFDHMDNGSKLSKCLYNAALFRIRQVFTGWDKEERTDNEKEVFEEIRVMQAAYPHIKVRRVLSYRALDAIMRANGNPDFFAGLPMQTSQRILKEAVSEFKAWLSALKEYRREPGKFTGRPRMPKYLKNERHTFYISNQDAVLYPVYREIDDGGTEGSDPEDMEGTCSRIYDGAELKLPLMKERLYLSHIPAGCELKEVQVKPYYGKIMLVLVLETEVLSVSASRPNIAGLDLGTDNIAAIVSTDHASRIYKGGAVLSENRSFHKRKAEAVGIITKGTKHKHADSAHLKRLSLHHDGFMRDMMHKVSTDIVRWCVEHGIGTLVIGTNRGWKQAVDMGRVNNRSFGSVPHDMLRKMIAYKASNEGIVIVEQEESYTSKADISVMDPLPVYGREEGTPVFSGKRTARGLYACRRGYVINADCNGAANILRKTFPDAWQGTEDFSFLAYPEAIGFKDLQRARTA